MRCKGGGRKRKEESCPELVPAILDVIDTHTAGCPMSATRWTYLLPSEIGERLLIKGLGTSQAVLKRILVSQGIGSRKLSKQEAIAYPDPEKRNQQFLNIASLKDLYLVNGYPVLSIDVKKKELLGRLFRNGQILCNEAVTCLDHDFKSSSTGVGIPLGIHNEGRREAHVYINDSNDTAEFNVACLRRYWQTTGRHLYQNNEPILLLVDGGGSNSSTNRLYKQELQEFADETRREIRVAHLPPYCSKYNPVEHKLFPFITKAWSGVLLDTVSTMINLVKIRCDNLKCGLKIIAEEIKGVFQKGVTVFDDYLEYCNIVHDEVNPKWNYRIIPM